MSVYLSVGIDVGSAFSFMSIVDPQGRVVQKPFKIFHNDLASLQRALDGIKKAEELHSMESRTFLESTGFYHFPLFYYLKESGLEVFVINPLISHSTRNAGIRKVKNDKVDSIQIARLGLSPDLKLSVMPDDLVLELRSLTRKYYDLVDQRTAYVNQLRAGLTQAFPQFLSVFAEYTGVTARMVLRHYPTPKHLLRARRKTLITKMAKASHQGNERAAKWYDQLMTAAKAALAFGVPLESLFFNIQEDLDSWEHISGRIKRVLQRIQELVIQHESREFVQQVRLLESIPGVGFLSSVTVMCEIGDFRAFQKPKQLVAYFGLDPAVKESGLFKASRVNMSKRGSPIARRAIFAIALSSIGVRKKGTPLNPVMREYYQHKIHSKTKMTALGAVMHKLCKIIFAVLRDMQPFVLKTPQEHCHQYEAGWLCQSA